MSQLRIVYVGCIMAGKMYSLRSLLGRHRKKLPQPEELLRKQPFDFELVSVGGEVSVSLMVADQRAANIDDLRSRAFLEELDVIAHADGLIFVIDSRIGREEANLGSFARLKRDLAGIGVDLSEKPIVFQANKRDCTEVVSMNWVREKFSSSKCAYVESAAHTHVGTGEAMDELFRLVARSAGL